MKRNIWIFGLALLIISFVFDPEILKFIEFLRFDVLTSIMAFVSLFIFTLGISIIYASFLRKDKKKIFLLGISLISGYILSYLLKLLIMRERPENALFLENSYSFPSTHATVIFSTVALMNKEFPKFKRWFLAIGLLIAFSRLYLGVHYTSDLIFGGFFGYGIGLVILHRKAFWTKLSGFFVH